MADGCSSALVAAFSPDATRVITANCNGVLQVYDAVTGLPIGARIGESLPRITAVAYAQDGTRFLAAYEDQAVRVWNASDSSPVGTYKSAGPATYGGFVSADFAPDGTRLLAAMRDGTVLVFAMATAEVLWTLKDPAAPGPIDQRLYDQWPSRRLFA